MRCQSLRRRRPCQASLTTADLVELFFESEITERFDRQASKQRDPRIQLGVRFEKRLPSLLLRSLHPCRIMNAPVRRHRLSRPYRAGLSRGLIAYREYEVHEGRAGPRKFAPVLAAKSAGAKTIPFKKFQREWIYFPGGMAPGAVGFELIFPQRVQDCLCHDAARRITGTQKQHIERSFIHGNPPLCAAGGRLLGLRIHSRRGGAAS